jgi:hypothetical protein
MIIFARVGKSTGFDGNIGYAFRIGIRTDIISILVYFDINDIDVDSKIQCAFIIRVETTL